MSGSRTSTSTSETTFPKTTHAIKIITKKDLNGRITSTECDFSILTTTHAALQTYISSLLPISDKHKYNVVFSQLKNGNIFEVAKKDERWDNQNQKSVMSLNSDQIRHFKAILVNGFSTFFKPFTQYYESQKSLHASSNDPLAKNEEFSKFLAAVRGGKISHLAELTSLYIALNIQTYIDLVCHIVMSGCFNFENVFAMVDLLMFAKNKIHGSELLVGAARKMSTSPFDELHTKTGLVIPYSKTFCAYMPRRVNAMGTVSFSAVTFGDEESTPPVEKPQDASTNGHDESASNKPNDAKVVDAQKIDDEKRQKYEAEGKRYVLTYDGTKIIDEVRNDLAEILKTPTISTRLAELSSDDQDFRKLLELLGLPDFGPLKEKLAPHLQKRHERALITKFREGDAFLLPQHSALLEANLLLLVALIEPSVSGNEVSLLERILNTSDMLDLGFNLISDFKVYAE